MVFKAFQAKGVDSVGSVSPERQEEVLVLMSRIQKQGASLNTSHACAGTTAATPASTTPPALLGSAGKEARNLSEWFALSSGPTGNNGKAAKLTITTPDSRTRLFCWLQPRVNSDLYYRAWYYFPQPVTPDGERKS